MNAVGVIGRYISKGVFTVAGPFHPFGGAVDIVVVEQQDGSFKSSPWNVRFGKFQGVLKTKEKVVNIIVNGVEADLHMYLDHKGEAYFLREVDVEGESGSYPSSSSDETDGKLQQEDDSRKILGSKNSVSSIADDGIEKSKDNGKIVVRTSSRRSRILGFVWGHKSMKEDPYQDTSVARVDSLERAEIAANLLEVRWSTNLNPQKLGKEETSRFSSINTSDGKDENELKTNDRDNRISSAVEGNMGNSPDNQMGDEGCDSCSEEIPNGYQFALKDLELSVEATRGLSDLYTKDHVVETSTGVEKALKGSYEVSSELSIESKQVTQNDKETVNAMGIIPENAGSNSQISLLRDSNSCYGENFNGEHFFDETNTVSQAFNVSEDENVSGGVQSLIFCGTSEISTVKMDDTRVQTQKSFADGECGIVGIHAVQLHATTEIHYVDTVTSVVAEDFEMETEKVLVPKNYPQQINPFNTCIYDGNTIGQEEPLTWADSDAQIISKDPIPGSIKEAKSSSTCSSFSSDLQDEKGVDGSVTSKCPNSLNSVCNSITIKESRMVPSTNSDEEQFLFSDFDVFKTNVNRNTEPDHQHLDDNEDYALVLTDGINEDYRFVNRNVESCSCPSPDSHQFFKQRTTSPIAIPQSHPISKEEVGHLVASLPIIRTGIDSPITHEIYHPRSYPVDSNSESFKWMKLCKDDPSFKSGGDAEQQVAQGQSKTEEYQISEELKSILLNPVAGSPAESTVDPVGNWKRWPFSFNRSKSRKITQSAIDGYLNFDTERTSDRNIGNGMDGEENTKHKAERKMVRSISPTSEQLASLNLKEGRNTVTFTFSTAVLGKQQVDARIYLWKWDTRIVVSDVDGTITKSDVLGQFMPFVGMDWSQTGVAHLFSAIKENGYQLLFLSARAISQAHHTRQFLFNLKQDGKALPEGPVVISPDGLFPSLYREVIRRAPHEFKIACLERIRELFPPDCNPFYAGFGNRDTDEISYLKVGIPKGKIFIINPKGEVAVNRRVDTKSYTSLHTLVHGIFPPMTSFEQEDYNSWNYWRLPPFIADS